MCLNGTPLASVDICNLPSCHRSPNLNIWAFKHHAERWWHEYRDKQEDTVWVEQLEEDVRRLMRLESTRVKGKIHKVIVQPAMLYGMEIGPVTSSHVKKLEVTEMKMGMRPHAKRPCEKRKHQGETEGREYPREVQESATQVVWPCKEARPRLRRKNDSEDGTTREKKARKTEAEMDGLCQPRHESHRNDERRGP